MYKAVVWKAALARVASSCVFYCTRAEWHEAVQCDELFKKSYDLFSNKGENNFNCAVGFFLLLNVSEMMPVQALDN